MRLTPRQLQATLPHHPVTMDRCLGLYNPPKPRQIVTVPWNVDACTILPQPLTPSRASSLCRGYLGAAAATHLDLNQRLATSAVSKPDSTQPNLTWRSTAAT